MKGIQKHNALRREYKDRHGDWPPRGWSSDKLEKKLGKSGGCGCGCGGSTSCGTKSAQHSNAALQDFWGFM